MKYGAILLIGLFALEPGVRARQAAHHETRTGPVRIEGCLGL
jgi:hypothetical protein